MTYATTSKYKGHPTFGVYESKEEAETHPDRPIVSLGLRKLRALFDHAEQLVAFMKANEKEVQSNATPQIIV